MEELVKRNYWDIMNYQGHGFVPVTRMQYSKKECEQIIQSIIKNQVLANRINMIIKDKESEIEYVEKQYPDIESESHNLHHEWKAKLDDLDMFKRLLL